MLRLQRWQRSAPLAFRQHLPKQALLIPDQRLRTFAALSRLPAAGAVHSFRERLHPAKAKFSDRNRFK